MLYWFPILALVAEFVAADTRHVGAQRILESLRPLAPSSTDALEYQPRGIKAPKHSWRYLAQYRRRVGSKPRPIAIAISQALFVTLRGTPAWKEPITLKVMGQAA
jgi:hypothetical protein